MGRGRKKTTKKQAAPAARSINRTPESYQAGFEKQIQSWGGHDLTRAIARENVGRLFRTYQNASTLIRMSMRNARPADRKSGYTMNGLKDLYKQGYNKGSYMERMGAAKNPYKAAQRIAKVLRQSKKAKSVGEIQNIFESNGLPFTK